MIIQAQAECISLCSSAFNSNHHHYQHFRVGAKAHASLPFLSRFPSVATMSTRSSSSHWRRRKRSEDVVSPSSSSSSRSSWRCAAASASPPPPPAPPTADKREVPELQTLIRRFWKVAAPYWSSDDKEQARMQLAAVFALTLATTGISVGFNFLGRDFYNALANKDQEQFTKQLLYYLGAFAGGIPVSTNCCTFT